MFEKILSYLGLQKKNKDLYFIWNHERGMWWGSRRVGYVKEVWLAGLYSYEEAHQIASEANGPLLEFTNDTPNESLVRYEPKRN